MSSKTMFGMIMYPVGVSQKEHPFFAKIKTLFYGRHNLEFEVKNRYK